MGFRKTEAVGIRKEGNKWDTFSKKKKIHLEASLPGTAHCDPRRRTRWWALQRWKAISWGWQESRAEDYVWPDFCKGSIGPQRKDENREGLPCGQTGVPMNCHAGGNPISTTWLLFYLPHVWLRMAGQRHSYLLLRRYLRVDECNQSKGRLWDLASTLLSWWQFLDPFHMKGLPKLWILLLSGKCWEFVTFFPLLPRWLTWCISALVCL